MSNLELFGLILAGGLAISGVAAAGFIAFNRFIEADKARTRRLDAAQGRGLPPEPSEKD